MKKTDEAIPKALLEVWEWKNRVYEDIKNLDFEGKKAYFDHGLAQAALELGARIEMRPDGSFVLV
ncbi:MAG: hypothetical protein HY706_10515 [Candidatus Hydrogenedentes bacterium]|nr:hypothetical protein [Candidatus Hydrogenedentota bacterium]